MAKKTIVHIIDNFGIGGAEKMLYSNFNNVANEYDIVLVTLNSKDEYGISSLNKSAQYCLNHSKKIHFFRSVLRLKKIIKKHKPCLVRSELFWSTLIAKVATPKQTKLLFTLHTAFGTHMYAHSRMHYLLDKITYRFNHYVIYVSQAAGDDFNKWIKFKNRHYLLYNCIDDVYYNNSYVSPSTKTGSALRMVVVGNSKPEKNYMYLLNALCQLNREGIEIDIYGSIPEKLEMETFIRQNKLPIFLKGRHLETWKILAQYDAFIMCSIVEGFGIAAAEAMAAGLPVLLSDILVFREISDNNALFFNPLIPKELTDIFIRLLKADVNLQAMSAKGITTAEKYKKETYLTNLFRIINNVLEN